MRKTKKTMAAIVTMLLTAAMVSTGCQNGNPENGESSKNVFQNIFESGTVSDTEQSGTSQTEPEDSLVCGFEMIVGTEEKVTEEELEECGRIIEARLPGNGLDDYKVTVDKENGVVKVSGQTRFLADSFDKNSIESELSGVAAGIAATGDLVFRSGSEITGKIIIDSKDVKKAYSKYQTGSDGAGQYVVVVELNDEGRDKFAEGTRENKGSTISIWMDDECISAPTVNDVITDGTAIISGSFDETSAAKLASTINSSKLPYKMFVEKYETIFPDDEEVTAALARIPWVLKTDTDTLTYGQWVYYTVDGVNDALTKINEEKTDADIDTIDWGTQKIEGKSALDWICDKAKDKSLRYLTMEKLARENNIVISDDTFNSSKTYYSYFYKNYYLSMFTSLGVSENSYCTASLRPELISDELFKKIYGKGGTKEVSDKDVEKYFVDNYVAYYYLSCDLEQIDDDGNMTDLDDATLEKYRANFRKYVDALNNNGKAVEDVAVQYMIDFEVETVPETNETRAKDDMTDSDLYKAVLDAKENVAFTKEIDGKLYLIYRIDTKSKLGHIHAADEDIDDGTEAIDRDAIVKNMKNDEYEKYLTEEQNKLAVEENEEVLKKYSVQRTIDVLKEQNKK